MARAISKSLSYFPLDVQLDTRVGVLETMFGNDGWAFYVKSLSFCFGKGEAFYEFGSLIQQAEIIKFFAVPFERWLEIARVAVELKLFDAQAFEEQKRITSPGIAKQLERVNAERESARNRKKKGSSENYPESSPSLFPQDPPESPQKGEPTAVWSNDGELIPNYKDSLPNYENSSGFGAANNRQSKVKESKELNIYIGNPPAGEYDALIALYFELKQGFPKRFENEILQVTQLERGQITELYQGWGYEKVSQAICTASWEGWKTLSTIKGYLQGKIQTKENRNVNNGKPGAPAPVTTERIEKLVNHFSGLLGKSR